MGNIITANAGSIPDAAAILRQGGLVAFPTETVYGLGANALDGQAVARIFAAKGRPQFNPLIVHVADIRMAAPFVEMNDRARALAAQFWPGPLTMILPRLSSCPVSDLCSAGLPTLAIRVPAHKTAQQLLKECGFPLAAPSANLSGHLSPTTPAHVAESLGDKVDMILAAGACNVGLESTILDMSTDQPAILRAGAIDAQQIADILGQDVRYEIEAIDQKTEKPKSPGQLLRHYAPGISVRLNAIDLEAGEALLAFGTDKFMGIKGGGSAKNLPDTARRNLSENSDLTEAAANLFRMLHDLDRPEHKAIAIMAIPEKGLGIAINERLKRAENATK